MKHARKHSTVAQPLFSLGQVVATPGALEALEQAGITPMRLIARHVFGDWGDLCEEDQEANRQAVKHGGRVFSSYEIGAGLNATKVWVITEADRSSTCALLPGEY
jgi:hypothetical protein